MMRMYFSPDVSKLREVPQAEAGQFLELAHERPELPPDTMMVEQLMQMIQFAREARLNGSLARF